MTLGTGQSFGDYQILKRIGAGGMAEVYMVRHMNAPPDSTPAVLRRILPNLSDNPNFVKMFLREARIINELEHNNIIRLLDFGRVQDDYYMVTEFIWGVTLREIIDRCTEQNIDIPYVFAASIVGDVCEGLDYAHHLKVEDKTVSIVHLDINPNNIMVDFDGKAKLLDFGIAHATYEGDHKAYNELKGTFAYMSPEQCQEMDVDHRSDIFSLGVVLYELTTRTPLFSRHNNEYMVLKSITEGIVPPPSNLLKGFPRTLEDIELIALKVSPSERYQEARDMKKALDEYLSEIEFDPMQETINAWLKRLFPERYNDFAPYMMPARKRTGEFNLPVIPETGVGKISPTPTPAKAKRPSGEYKVTDSVEKKASDADPLELTPAEISSAQQAPKADSDRKQAASGSGIRPKAATTRKRTESKPVPAQVTPPASRVKETPAEVEEPEDNSAIALTPDDMDTGKSSPEPKGEARGHLTYTGILLLLLVALVWYVSSEQTKSYQIYSDYGRLYVYATDDSRLEKEPVKATLDNKESLNLPIQGHFLPPGTHEIHIDDQRFEQERLRFDIGEDNPVQGFYVDLKPRLN